MKRGQGRVFQRGSIWWIAYYAPRNGRSVEHREPGGETEKEARRLLKDRLAEVTIAVKGIRPFHGPHQERVPLSEILDDLERHYEVSGKSLPQLRSHLRHVRAYFSMDRALAVAPDRVLNYIAHRQQEKAAPATISREIEGLQRAFTYAVETGKLSQAPRFPSLPEHNAREGFFERGDFEAVLANVADPDVSDFLSWFFWTGMRPKEIKSLTWEAFDRETWTIRLHARDAKIRKGRALGLEGPLREIIERRIEARRLDCPFIFHRAGRQMGEFRKTWRTACKGAGLVGMLPYDLRRTAVRNMVRAGVDESVAMRISGHKTRAVFDRYNIVSDEDIRQAVRTTADYVSSLPVERTVVPLTARKAAKR